MTVYICDSIQRLHAKIGWRDELQAHEPLDHVTQKLETFPREKDYLDTFDQSMYYLLEEVKPRYDRVVSSTEAREVNEAKQKEEGLAKAAAKAATNPKSKSVPKKPHNTGSTEGEPTAKALGKKVNGAVTDWSMIERGILCHDSDLSKWGGWYGSTEGSGFALVSSNSVDVAHDMMTGGTTNFTGQRWKMMWEHDDVTGTMRIDPNFRVDWGSKDNQIHADDFDDQENEKLNILNRLVAEAALEIFKLMRPKTTAMLESLVGRDRFHLATDIALPMNQAKVKCEDENEIERKSVTGGVNASRFFNTIVEGYDANVPRMSGAGEFLTHHESDWRLPALHPNAAEKDALALEAKNRRLMGLLKGVGYEFNGRRITADDLGVGPTHDTFAIILVGRIVIEQLVKIHNAKLGDPRPDHPDNQHHGEESRGPEVGRSSERV